MIHITSFYDREKRHQELELAEKATVKEVLAKLNINPETVIVSKNDAIILENEELKDKDSLKIISVISGG